MEKKLIPFIVMIVFFIFTEVFENIKKKHEEIFFNRPKVCKISIVLIEMSIMILWFRVAKIFYDIGMRFIMLFWSIGFILLLYSIYKLFRDMQLEISLIDYEIFDEVLMTTFDHYGYELEEEKDEDDEGNKIKFVIKNTNSYIVMTKGAKGKYIDKYIHIHIVKYRKVENIKEIIEEIRNVLIEKPQVNKSFYVGIRSFIPLLAGIMAGGAWWFIMLR